MLNKLKHFYVNKYIVSPFAKHKYYISYCFKHKALWYRNYKVASRTIDKMLRDSEGEKNYIYSSEVGYIPSRYKNYFKFAFVRNPEERFISAWKNLVLKRNYFKFHPEEYKKMKQLDNFVTWAKQWDKKSCDEHLRAQYALIDSENADFIGRMEYFDRDMEYVAGQIGIKYEKAQKLNVSTIEIDEISDALRSDIQDMYRKDYDLFYSGHYESDISK
ncbi:MAG: sulfotransferase family 2 domain-containing protein [Candidatus Marinimicrobia bacterium]|nr:sulfotransferase family 2 domain-containing protein [Candidatus Neomarinimicrobiota bacterium]